MTKAPFALYACIFLVTIFIEVAKRADDVLRKMAPVIAAGHLDSSNIDKCKQEMQLRQKMINADVSSILIQLERILANDDRSERNNESESKMCMK